MSETPWLTVDEAAGYLKFSPETIRRACREDRLRHAQIGGARGKLLTKREWLDEWALAHVRGGK